MAEKQKNNDTGGIKWRPLILRFTLSGALMYLLIIKLDWQQVGKIALEAKTPFVVAMLLSMFCERVYANFRWYIFAKHNDSDANFFALLKITFASSFIGMFLPGAATEILRVVGQSRKSKNLTHAVSSVFADRYLGMFSLATIAAISSLLVGNKLHPTIGITAISLSVGMLLASLLAFGRASERIFSLIPEKGFLKPAKQKAQKIMACLSEMWRDRQTMSSAIMHGFGIQALRIASIYIGALALDVHLDYTFIIALGSIAYFVMLVPISIGGLGTREATFVYILGTAGIASELAFTLSIMHYLATIVVTLPGAWTSFTAFSKSQSAD